MGYPKSPDGTPLQALRALRLGQSRFLRTDDGSAPMIINANSGSPTVLWNGTGGSDTGGDWTRGGTAGQSESAAAMKSGTNGLDTGVRASADVTTFDNGSLIDVSVEDSVSFWMNPQAFPVGAKLLVQWFVGASAKGSELDVVNYVSNFDIGVWQKVTIPMDDFSLTENIDRLQFKYDVAGQHFYFDDIDLNPNGGGVGPKTFRVAAPVGEIYHVSCLSLIVAAGTGWDADKFANIVSGLTNGLLIRHHDLDTASDIWSVVMKNNIDLYGRLIEINSVDFAGNKRMSVFELESGTASIEVTDKQVIEILIRDDLSSLNDVRAFLKYGVEVIEV